MKRWNFLTLVVSVLLIHGCATQGKNTLDYQKNPPITVANEIVVKDSYSAVWDKLVKELSKSYYVINNIDKESRIINMSFSSTSPSKYIDCGTTVRTYTQSDKTEKFAYEVASSSTYKMATPRQPDPKFYYYSIIKRTTNLEGRSNIYLAPDEGDKSKTRVAVNTRYILSITNSGNVFVENLAGRVINSAPISAEPPHTIAFNTNKPNLDESGSSDSVTCFGKGHLETEILKLIQN